MKNQQRSKTFFLITVMSAITLSGMLIACAGVPAPKEQMAVAEAAVTHASTQSTSENASAELQTAVDKLASARSAMNQGEFERARQLAEQTELDAQVAELHAQTARSRKAAVESQDAARALQEELARKSRR